MKRSQSLCLFLLSFASLILGSCKNPPPLLEECAIGFGKVVCADLRLPNGSQTYELEFEAARKLGFVCRSQASEALLWDWITNRAKVRGVQKMTRDDAESIVEFLNEHLPDRFNL